jgi:hypothetical protein
VVAAINLPCSPGDGSLPDNRKKQEITSKILKAVVDMKINRYPEEEAAFNWLRQSC